MTLSTSLACGDVLQLEKDAQQLIDLGQNVFHIDVMDGHLVPNFCLGPDVVRALHQRFDCVLDVHLMATNAPEYIEQLAECGADALTVHLGGGAPPEQMLRAIRRAGMKAGIALSPGEPFERVRPCLPWADLVLIMGVKPGFSGQSFRPECVDALKEAAAYRAQQGAGYKISVDGGIDLEKGRLCRRYGADMLVMGAFSFYRQGVLQPDQVRAYAAGIER